MRRNPCQVYRLYNITMLTAILATLKAYLLQYSKRFETMLFF